jgi:hypothetical protein
MLAGIYEVLLVLFFGALLFLFVYFLLLRKSYPRIPGSRKAFLTN